MAITGHASFIPTTEDFLDHWLTVNGEMGDPMVIPQAAAGEAAEVNQEGLDTLYTQLVAQHGSVAGALNELALAREDVELKKAALLVRLKQFNAAVRGLLANTKWPEALSDAPAQGDAPDAWRNAIDDALSVWGKINAQNALGVGVPLFLFGDLTLAQFTTLAEALRLGFRTKRAADKTATIERAERNDLERRIYAILKAYRAVMPTKFAPGSPFTLSLPRLTPESTGHTPNPVSASGAWNVPLQAAKVTHGVSAEPNVKRYDLRGVPGPSYDTEDEIQVASHGPADPAEFVTTFGLGAPGQIVGLRVVVVLETDHEAGSPAVYVTRPGS